MIARIIDWSARNIMIVLIATLLAVAGGIYALRHLPLDAIPDLSDTQVIVYTNYPGQAPQVVEDQVTYPLATAMLTVPKSKVVRGFSFFGVSFVYIIFEDGTDIYWARSRVLEYLNAAAARLPTGVTPVLGPDATSVGWVYQYAVTSKDLNLAQTRSIQDWTLRYGLAKAEGVAEVASAGGFVKQYNVVVDPQRLRDLGITLDKIREVIRASNTDVGGRTLELSEFEFVVRGKGYLRGLDDLGKIVVKVDNGTPVLLRDVARLELGPDERRGITELNGEGEVASGITLQRFGLNALDVIDNVKKRIAELAASLPKGTDIVPVYDRSNLIYAAIDTLKHTLLEESAIVALVCIVFLSAHPQRACRHPHAAGGHPDGVRRHALARPRRQHHEPGRHRDRHRRHDRRRDCDDRERAQASGACGAGQAARRNPHRSGERSRPRAVLQPSHYHRVVHADLHAGIAGRTAVRPACLHQDLLDGGGGDPLHDAGAGADDPVRARAYRPRAEEPHQPGADLDLPPDHQGGAEGEDAHDPRGACRPWRERLARPQLGSEFMPSLNEGTLLYMPTTLPGISITKAAELLQMQDRIIKSFPEVASVYGKAGRAETSTDPAPTEMFETVINLKPKEEWRPGVTIESLDRGDGQGAAISRRLERLDHADQGAHRHAGDRHPHACRHQGAGQGSDGAGPGREADRDRGPEGSRHHERLCGARDRRLLPRHRARPRRARPLRPAHRQSAGHDRHGARRRSRHHDGRRPRALYGQCPLSARFPGQSRSHRARCAGAAAGRRRGALGEVAKVQQTRGPNAIRTENGQLAVYIYVDMQGRDLGGYVADAQKAVADNVKLPTGTYLQWSGQFEYMQRAIAKLKIVVPLTLAIIFLLLYLNFGTLTETLIVMLSLPFALVGGLWLMWWLGFNMSVAVAVGFIALAGVAAETGVVMLIYLDHALQEVKAEREAQGEPFTKADLNRAIMLGAVERVRPKMMTVVAIMAGLSADPLEHGNRLGGDAAHRRAHDRRHGLVDGPDADRHPGHLRACQRYRTPEGPRALNGAGNSGLWSDRRDP